MGAVELALLGFIGFNALLAGAGLLTLAGRRRRAP